MTPGKLAYLDLLKKTIVRLPMGPADIALRGQVAEVAETKLEAIDDWLTRSAHSTEQSLDLQARAAGEDWPEQGESMIGLARLDNVQRCLLDVIANGVEGDAIETVSGEAAP